ncbi:hypothetical protein Tco_1488998, partial [Tanacetum coccineum]
MAEIIMISDSSDDSKSPSIPRVPVYGPSVQGLLDNYGYDNIEDYLSDFLFSKHREGGYHSAHWMRTPERCADKSKEKRK